MGEPVRISVTLSGGAALGAYQAGAMAAMAVAVQQLQARHGDRVVVDAVGGASAGALVALFTAHSPLAGIDPLWLLNEAWVERVSLELLAGRSSRAPLSFRRLREQVGELVDPRTDDGRAAHRVADPQQTSVAMHVALTGLQGLN
ncbi:MAG: patatin-like phospholipase family protein [Actinomycetota bacterium]|nr:patatin-like phospholipase family protein [Actinomycetota bacterium]